MSSVFLAFVLLPLLAITYRSFTSNWIAYSPLYAKPLTPAMENYLEAIFNLMKEKRVARAKDIALTYNLNFHIIFPKQRVLIISVDRPQNTAYERLFLLFIN